MDVVTTFREFYGDEEARFVYFLLHDVDVKFPPPEVSFGVTPFKRRRGIFNYGPITPKDPYDRVMDVFRNHGHVDDKSGAQPLASEKLLGTGWKKEEGNTKFIHDNPWQEDWEEMKNSQRFVTASGKTTLTTGGNLDNFSKSLGLTSETEQAVDTNTKEEKIKQPPSSSPPLMWDV